MTMHFNTRSLTGAKHYYDRESDKINFNTRSLTGAKHQLNSEL